MEIYIEKVLVFNILIHLLLVITIIFLTNNKVLKRNILIGIILGTINLLFYLKTQNNIPKLVFVIVPFITFYNIKSTLLYLMLNICLGGVTGVINLSFEYYYEVIFLFSIIISLITIFLRNNTNKLIVIINADKEHKFISFYDTGCIVNFGLTPIIILNEKFNIKLSYFSEITINTISGETKHKVYKAKNIYLMQNNEKIEKHCLIIKAKIDYDVIVGKNFIGGI